MLQSAAYKAMLVVGTVGRTNFTYPTLPSKIWGAHVKGDGITLFISVTDYALDQYLKMAVMVSHQEEFEMKYLPMLLLIMAVLPGCTESKLDTSTDETLKSSMEVMRNSLSPEKKAEFESAVQTITYSGLGKAIGNTAGNPAGFKTSLLEEFNGKTANQIISQADLITAERKKKQFEQAASEAEEVKEKIAELEKKKHNLEKSKENLSKFNILRSRFYYGMDNYLTKPIIELTVKNNTGRAVSKVYFDSVLASPGREIPWLKASVNYDIPGGLESGEEVTWKLAPNMFSDWSKAPKDRDDMVLTVIVNRIDGADGKPIFEAAFSEQDEKTLEGLYSRLEKLKKTLGG